MPVAIASPPIPSTKDILLMSQQSDYKLTPKKRVKKKSSPKRVKVDGNVYLKRKWSMWFDECSSEVDKTKIGTFETVQDFWRYYNQLVEPSKFPDRSNLSIYKENSTLSSIPDKTCKWIIPCSKEDTGKVWMKVVVALLGEQFSGNSHIAGVSLSVFCVLDKVVVWGNQQTTPECRDRTMCQLKKLIENDTSHMLSFAPGLRLSSGGEQGSSSSSMNNSKKFVSSNDLTADETATQRHKKSSSFSNSQFPELSSNHKGHRKTKSFSKRGTKSLSFSGNLSEGANHAVAQRASLLTRLQQGPKAEPFQISKREAKVSVAPIPSVKAAQPSASLNLPRMLALFVLVLLVLSGLLFTPK